MTSLKTLTKRKDFVDIAKGSRWVAPAFILQTKLRQEPTDNSVRVGFTASGKVGGAVSRNRAKRRLREAVRQVFLENAKAGWDYVLVAKAPKIFEIAHEELCKDLKWSLKKIHQEAGQGLRKKDA